MAKGTRNLESSPDNFQERSLFAKNQSLALRHRKILTALEIGLQSRSIGFVGSEAVEGNQSPGDIVSAFIGKEVSDKMAAAARNDAAPVLSVFLEPVSLKRIDLVTNETRDSHRLPPAVWLGQPNRTALESAGSKGSHQELNGFAPGHFSVGISARLHLENYVICGTLRTSITIKV